MKSWFLGMAISGLSIALFAFHDQKRLLFWLGYAVVSALLHIGAAINEKK